MSRLIEYGYWVLIGVLAWVVFQIGADVGKAATIFVVIMLVPLLGGVLWLVIFRGVRPRIFRGSDDEE